MLGGEGAVVWEKTEKSLAVEIAVKLLRSLRLKQVLHSASCPSVQDRLVVKLVASPV